MKKRILCFMMVLTVVSGLLTGCGKKSGGNTPQDSNQEGVSNQENVQGDNNVTGTEDFQQDGEKPNSDIVAYIMENNGQVPAGVGQSYIEEGKITEEDIAPIIYEIVEGIKNLDAEVMKPYLTEDDYEDYSEYFEKIRKDKEGLNFWHETIGNINYYPNANIMIGKDLEYIYSVWYTDCYKSNAVIPEGDSEDFSKEYALNIYNTYYKDAPYTAAYGLYIDYMIEDNRLVIDIDDIFYSIGYEDLSDILYSYEDDMVFNYNSVLLAGEDCFDLGYDYILGEIDNVDVYLNKDMESIVNMTIATREEGETSIYWECLDEYCLNEANKAIVDQYIQENCYILRGVDWITVFYPSDYELFPLYHLTEEDRADIEEKGINIMDKSCVFGVEDSPSMFYDIVQVMKCKELVQ